MRYKSEGVAKGLPMQAFCSMNNIPYNAFEKYLKLRRHFSTAHKINITDIPEKESGTDASEPDSTLETAPTGKSAPKDRESLRIMVDIRMTNGINIRQRNLDYSTLFDTLIPATEFALSERRTKLAWIMPNAKRIPERNS